jgi:hypothetical protein
VREAERKRAESRDRGCGKGASRCYPCIILVKEPAHWASARSRNHTRLPPPRFVNALLGHVVLFASQLIFLLATAIFLFLFFDKALEYKMSISRYVIILFGLFSLFCYTRELERFGSRLLGREGADRTQNQE